MRAPWWWKLVAPHRRILWLGLGATVLCQDLSRRLTGARPSDGYFRACGQLADAIIAGGFEELAGIPRQEIMMKYENR